MYRKVEISMLTEQRTCFSSTKTRLDDKNEKGKKDISLIYSRKIKSSIFIKAKNNADAIIGENMGGWMNHGGWYKSGW